MLNLGGVILDSSSIIILLIVLCIIFLFFSITLKPLTLFIKFIKQCSIGILLITLLNYALSFLGIFIGLNYITAITVGILGIPGLVSLYIIQLIF